MTNTTVEDILDLARWAPSPENMQTWRFELVDDKHFVVHGFDVRDTHKLDFEGHASLLGLGALLETITIAASIYQLQVRFQRRLNTPIQQHIFDVYLEQASSLKSDSLYPYITTRATQRHLMSPCSLTTQEKTLLEKSVGDRYRVVWLDGFKQKSAIGNLLFKADGIRFSIPEIFERDRNAVEWNSQLSEDRIPDGALGINPIAKSIMRWLASNRKYDKLLSYVARSPLPRFEMDLLPAIFCAGHFIITAHNPLKTVDDYVAVGRCMQRFWLTATTLGIMLHPEFMPLCFSDYVLNNRYPSQIERLNKQVKLLFATFTKLVGEQTVAHAVFMGRIGKSSPPKARSVRLPLNKLIKSKSS